MDVRLEFSFEQPAEKLWGILSDFGNFSWLAPTKSHGEGVGMIRIVSYPYNPLPLTERLEAIDHAGMSLRYSVDLAAELSLSEFTVSNQVIPVSPRQCRVAICTHFEAASESYEEDLKTVIEMMAEWSAEKMLAHLHAEGKEGAQPRSV